MPNFTFTSPEGKQYTVTGPDGSTQEEAFQHLQTQLASTAQMGQQEAENRRGMDATASNIANIVPGAIRGAASIGSTLLAPIDMAKDALNGKGLSLQSNRDRRAETDAGLQTLGADPNSVGYKMGKLGGEIAGTAGAGGVVANGVRAVAPGAEALATAIETGGLRAGATPGVVNMGTRVAGGAINGATQAGLINPTDAGRGAVVGAVLPPALAGTGKLARAIGGSLSIGDANRSLAQKAIDEYGIPLGVGDIADGGTIKAVRSILNDAPFSGGVGAAQRQNVQQAFNKAVGKTFGANEPSLTADVMDAAKKRMGSEFDRIWNNNSLQVDGPMLNKLSTLQQQAAKLPSGEGQSLSAEINDLMGKMQQDANGNVIIPGDVANNFQSYLRRRAEGSAGLKNELGDLRQSIISAFNRSVSSTDAAALALNRSQYKAFKTVEPLLNGAEVGIAGRTPGDVPAALLPRAIVNSYSQPAGNALSDLSQIGSRFMVDRTAKTGGSMRAALQNSALGGAITYGGLTGSPLLAASAIPAAVGTNALLGSPKVASFLVNRTPNKLMQLMGSQGTQQIPYLVAPALSDR